jgi:uncharacterized repeat protein (TIGR03803 family)
MRPSKPASSCNVAALLTLSIFSFSISGIAEPSEHVLYAFSSPPPGCSSPSAPLIADAVGNLYGTTYDLGAYKDGCVFELSPSDNGWQYTLLSSFSGPDGAYPASGLVFDKLGNLYGATGGGGTYGGGAAFELSPLAGGGWGETVLYSFGNGDDGYDPRSKLIFDNAGNLYGTTEFGGAGRTGTVFKLSPSQAGWTETILYAFPDSVSGPNGSNPVGGVVMDREGKLYGNTNVGGALGDGAVYELSPSDGGYDEKVIYSFNVYDGLQPISGLTMDRNGNLYGTTSSGGDMSVCYYVGCGIVFELTKDTEGNWNEKILHEMTGSDGSYTVGPVVFDSAGNLYAAAQFGGNNGMGSVFELTPTRSGPWKETMLHLFDYQFPNGKDGESPYAGVIFDRGRVFGTTSGGGGSYNSGTVFEITPLENAPAAPDTSEEQP